MANANKGDVGLLFMCLLATYTSLSILFIDCVIYFFFIFWSSLYSLDMDFLSGRDHLPFCRLSPYSLVVSFVVQNLFELVIITFVSSLSYSVLGLDFHNGDSCNHNLRSPVYPLRRFFP